MEIGAKPEIGWLEAEIGFSLCFAGCVSNSEASAR